MKRKNCQGRHPHSVLLERNHCSTTYELTFRVLLWFLRQADEPSWQDVSKEWNVDRSTAYRWLAVFRDAIGTTKLPYPDIAEKLGVTKANQRRFELHPWRQTLYPQKTGENVP